MPIMAKYKIAFQSSGNLTPFQTSLIFDLVLATNEQFISSVGSFSRDLSIERATHIIINPTVPFAPKHHESKPYSVMYPPASEPTTPPIPTQAQEKV